MRAKSRPVQRICENHDCRAKFWPWRDGHRHCCEGCRRKAQIVDAQLRLQAQLEEAEGRRVAAVLRSPAESESPRKPSWLSNKLSSGF